MRVLAWLIAAMIVAGPALAQQSGTKWRERQQDGVVEYLTENSSGDSFMLSCKAGGHSSLASGRIVIGGTGPGKKGSIKVSIDGVGLNVAVGQDAGMTTGCLTCAENYVAMWTALRTGYDLEVQFQDGRNAKFSLEGSGTVLPELPCMPGNNLAQNAPLPRKKPNLDATPAIARCQELAGENPDEQKKCMFGQIEAIGEVVTLSNDFVGSQVYALIFDSCQFEQAPDGSEFFSDWRALHDCLKRSISTTATPG